MQLELRPLLHGRKPSRNIQKNNETITATVIWVAGAVLPDVKPVFHFSYLEKVSSTAHFAGLLNSTPCLSPCSNVPSPSCRVSQESPAKILMTLFPSTWRTHPLSKHVDQATVLWRQRNQQIQTWLIKENSPFTFNKKNQLVTISN